VAMTQTPDVSVIVLNYNGRSHLEMCLRAVHAQQNVALECILVDNGSIDGSVAFVRERFPWVRLVELDHNTGFATGNNRGAEVATGRLLAFLNNDTRPDAHWLAALCSGLDEQHGIAFATSRIVYMQDPTMIDSAGDSVTRSGGAFKRGHGDAAAKYLEPCEVFGACGAAFVMPRALFNDVGGFDEDFFLSHEDVDLSYRLRLRGYRCMYVPDSIVHHAVSATLGRVSDNSIYYGQRNLEWLYLKNTPLKLLLLSLPLHLVYVAAAAIYFATMGKLRVFAAAKWAAFKGVPRAWSKRRAVQASRRASDAEIWAKLEPGWLRVKVREKRFDTGVMR
jgi:GT2 family glycosyltransferase